MNKLTYVAFKGHWVPNSKINQVIVIDWMHWSELQLVISCIKDYGRVRFFFLSSESMRASIIVLCWVEMPVIVRQHMLWLVNKLLCNLLVVRRDRHPKPSIVLLAHISKQESVIVKFGGWENMLKVLLEVHQKKAFTCFLCIFTCLKR